MLPPLNEGRPVGGKLLQSPSPALPSAGASSSAVQPTPPAEVFPVEPPVINQR
jgi:hypothetical protein